MRWLVLMSSVSALLACGGTQPAPIAPAPEAPRIVRDDELPTEDREVRLVGRYGQMKVEARVGDPARDPGFVVLWVGKRPVRLGLSPRPAEERDRLFDETVEVRGLFQLRPPVHEAYAAEPPRMEPIPVLIPIVEPLVLSPRSALLSPAPNPSE